MTIESESDLIAGLTPRQREVIERIDRRMPIKLIANELGISPSRVNQHIRALKDRFGAESLAELVEAYRAHRPAQGSDARAPNGDGQGSEQAARDGPGDGPGAPPSSRSAARSAKRQPPRGRAPARGAALLILIALALAAALFIVG